ncbi:hypothetical protein PTTG_08268 [Puccinia triticina 1-1 BBBD Race 1]|uniref:CMP/dCMP-type deaminase domain-containing protein n=2 Tax=Puccinia triticina TaxID=208348 RepID=A0A0C4F570_PUCT1|nr:uncharacterized protein PtA15_6A497 [Puccinia triticina]OAV89027.1 hypothetical protein PTTG_08268 [Puccinia triticina 1-1 BBBD Race 1]WAQ85868.1 hypothetical protein PtA15_6A497 [Puccinia triticina]WAR55760.1 hypothetical protein PtB15_6B503 [Puccinia triticina]
MHVTTTSPVQVDRKPRGGDCVQEIRLFLRSKMITTSDELHFECMRKAIALARLSKPIPTAFCVGCLMTKTGTLEVVSTGYSRELEGNTHAEQCAIMKLLDGRSASMPTGDLDLYTTMEPCSVRLSGNKPCADLILEFNRSHHPHLRIKNIYLGVVEPDDFVNCDGVKKLQDSGLTIFQVIGFKEECLKIARGEDTNSS